MPWQKLCDLADLAPGEIRPFAAGGIEVLLVRGEQGLMAIPPSCPHMDNPLCEGFFDGTVLTCNKHLWQWSVPDGAPMGEAEVALLRYETQARGNEVWVNVEQELVYEEDT